jgi:hypothetical protein
MLGGRVWRRSEAEKLLPSILPGDAGSDYERYLSTEELLGLGRPPTRVHHATALQVTHQTSELWLKLAWNDADGQSA